MDKNYENLNHEELNILKFLGRFLQKHCLELQLRHFNVNFTKGSCL